MPPRQIWLFQLGCWLACATAALHLVAHVAIGGTAAPAAASSVATDAVQPAQEVPPYLLLVPGQEWPAREKVADGLSLSLVALLATIGAAGLAVGKRGHGDALLMRGVARAYAVGAAAVLVVSIFDFFSVQTFFLSMVALCFALAAVPET